MKIAVAGTGYVGLSIACLLSQHNEVKAVDIIKEKVDLINARKSPIQDDYIEKYLAEKDLNLEATLDAEYAYSDADFVVIAAPTYTASTSIYLTPQISESGSLDYNSQMANSKLVTNAVNLLTQNNIMSEVAKDVGMENAESVKKCITVTNEANTEIITITATTTDPKLSKNIANGTVSTFTKTMQKNLNVRNIEVVDKAKLSYVPSGPNIKKNTLLATMVGFVLGCGYAVLRFLFDNRLRTKEEAEKYLGIPVFCEIPEL